jgi:hypothetical protein
MGRCTSKNKPDGTIDPITDQGQHAEESRKAGESPGADPDDGTAAGH